MKSFHDTPIFRCGDKAVLRRFFIRYGIDTAAPEIILINSIANAFSMLPYENLTKIIKADGVISPRSAMRLPDEVLADHLKWGTGGTCFSLTAAIIAVYDSLGIEAYPILADRHYGTNTHCGLLVKNDRKTLLVDPGYLLFTPTPLPSSATVSIEMGYTTVELKPLQGGKRIELATAVKGSRKTRLTYKTDIVDPETFVNAWIASFGWEMMTYPVLTRSSAGEHFYLQGDLLSIRNSEKTIRSHLSINQQLSFIGNRMGISQTIIEKAWKVLKYGET